MRWPLLACSLSRLRRARGARTGHERGAREARGARADGARARVAPRVGFAARRAHEWDAPEVGGELRRQVAQLVGEERVGAVIREKRKRVGEVGKVHALLAPLAEHAQDGAQAHEHDEQRVEPLARLVDPRHQDALAAEAVDEGDAVRDADQLGAHRRRRKYGPNDEAL